MIKTPKPRKVRSTPAVPGSGFQNQRPKLLHLYPAVPSRAHLNLRKMSLRDRFCGCRIPVVFWSNKAPVASPSLWLSGISLLRHTKEERKESKEGRKEGKTDTWAPGHAALAGEPSAREQE